MAKIKYNKQRDSPDNVIGCCKCNEEIENIRTFWSTKCKRCVFASFVQELIDAKGFGKNEIRELFESGFYLAKER